MSVDATLRAAERAYNALTWASPLPDLAATREALSQARQRAGLVSCALCRVRAPEPSHGALCASCT